jgi:hypothetical protein
MKLVALDFNAEGVERQRMLLKDFSVSLRLCGE